MEAEKWIEEFEVVTGRKFMQFNPPQAILFGGGNMTPCRLTIYGKSIGPSETFTWNGGTSNPYTRTNLKAAIKAVKEKQDV